MLACTLLNQNRLGKGSHTHKAEIGGPRKQFTHCSNSWLKPGITAELAPVKSCKKPYRAQCSNHESQGKRLLNCLEHFCLEM